MKDFLRVVRVVKKEFPCYQVKVERRKVKKIIYADCEKKSDGSFRIRICPTLNENHAIDIFIHEFAHVIAWDKPGDDHGYEWGKAYSKVYRVYVKKYVNIVNGN